MRLDKFIARGRIINLKSNDLKGAIDELLSVTAGCFKDLDKNDLMDALLKREEQMTTYLGNGVSMPHIRIQMPRRYILAVGRSANGIVYDGYNDGDKTHLVILLIAGETEQDYLQVLASIARLLKDKRFVDELVEAPSIDIIHQKLIHGMSGTVSKPLETRKERMNKLIFRQAEKIARGTACSTLVIFSDTLTTGMDTSKFFPDFRSILVTRTASDITADDRKPVATVQVRTFSRQRLSQLRSSILIGITRGLIRFTDRLCCVGGIAGSNQFDTVVVVDVEKEFQVLFKEQADILPADVKPEVLERVLAIATELAVEGREGRPVGSLFTLGDADKVITMTKPLVMNPFFGYKEEDRNIMNPFMDETIKEFSLLDGAFVVRGDGVVMSAGSLLHAPDYYHTLPSGLGSRHAAAAAISIATDCISLAISSSTGQVTLFRRGVRLPLIEKGMGAGY